MKYYATSAKGGKLNTGILTDNSWSQKWVCSHSKLKLKKLNPHFALIYSLTFCSLLRAAKLFLKYVVFIWGVHNQFPMSFF